MSRKRTDRMAVALNRGRCCADTSVLAHRPATAEQRHAVNGEGGSGNHVESESECRGELGRQRRSRPSSE